MRPSGIGLSLWESVERFRCPKEQQCSPSAEAEPSQPRMTPASHLAPGDMPESWRQKGEVCPELYSLKKKNKAKQKRRRTGKEKPAGIEFQPALRSFIGAAQEGGCILANTEANCTSRPRYPCRASR